MSAITQSGTELLEQFERAARAAAASVERVERSAEALDRALRGATAGLRRILLAELDDLPAELLAAFRRAPGVIISPTDEQLASAEAGITDAFAGVARTGSVCVSVTPRLGGAISLFAPLHVAILDAANIVARPRDVFDPQQLGGKGLTRDFVFITGPSATADMGPLVRGVHGPHRLHIIVLCESFR